MARRGRFGRLPRRAPDLTGAIVAMMREYWNTTENIMVSAWKSGGEVDGKPVTDQRLLDFWLERRNSVQTDDPLWDYYDQQHSQYKFAIDESKVGLSYAQHKMSAREVAKWYKGQAGQFAQDSEMWRTVMGQAAKFLDAAKAQARAASAEARRKAYINMRNQTMKDYEWPSQIAIGGLTNILQGYNILAGPQVGTPLDEQGSTGGPSGEQITDLTMSDYSQWDNVIDAINTPGSDYYDYWHNQILPQARRQGLDLTTPFDESDIAALYDRNIAGIDKEIALAKKFKDVAPSSELDNLRAGRTSMVNAKAYVLTLDEAGQYADARTNLDTVLQDAVNGSADPFAAMKAITDYYNQLGALNTKVGAQNPLFTSSLLGEQAALLGQSPGNSLTIKEGALVTPFMSSPSEGQDAAYLASITAHYREIITLAGDGDHVLRQNQQTGEWEAPTYAQISAETGGQFVIIPVKSSTTLLEPMPGTTGTQQHSEGQTDALDPNQGLRPKANVTPLTVSYGQAFSVIPMIARAPTTNVDPATGRELGDPTTTPRDQNIGLITYLPDGDGNLTVPIYGIYASGGQLRWTYDNPFSQGTTTQKQFIDANSQGLVVTVPTSGLIYIDKTTSQPVAGPDPTNPNIVAQFNPQAGINPLMTRPYDPTTFIDPGLAFMSSTDAGRQTLGAMTPDEIYHAFRASPWVWDDASKIGEFWQDVSNVKSTIAAQNDPSNWNARLNSEYAFYNSITQGRRGNMNMPNLWSGQINEMQRSSLVHSEVTERTAGGFGAGTFTDLPNPAKPPTAPGQPYTLGVTTPAAVPGQPYNPLGVVTPAATPGQPYNPLAPGGGQQPTVQTPTNIKVPGMPASAPPSGPAAPGYRDPNTPFGPRAPTPSALPPPNMGPLPPAPGAPVPNIPGVSNRPRTPHEWDPFGPVTH